MVTPKAAGFSLRYPSRPRFLTGPGRAATPTTVTGRGFSRRRLLSLAPAGLLAACGRSRRPAPVSMWAMGTEGDNGSRMLPPFEARTGLSVALQSIPWTAAHEKILTGYAGRSLPDVMMVRNDWLPELVLLGAVRPVPPTLMAGQQPVAAADATVGGTPYALPWIMDTMVQFYRRDLVAAAGYDVPPDNWAEWKRMAHAIKRRRPDRFAVLMLLDWPEHLFGYAAQQPEPLLRDRNGYGNFRTDGFRAALAHYKSLFDEGLAPKALGTDIVDTITVFIEGWVAIAPAGGDLLHDFYLYPDRIARRQWDAAVMPGPRGFATGPITGSSLAVSHNAADPAAAWALAGYFGSAPVQVAFGRINGKMPSRPAAWTAPEIAQDPVSQVFVRQLSDVRAPPQIPEWQRILDEVQLVAEHMVRGDLTVDAAARAMDERVDGILAKRRWLLDRGLVA
jgi:multiple sugar transport system substrate-binding protein